MAAAPQGVEESPGSNENTMPDNVRAPARR